MSEALHHKFRPKRFESVVGQTAVIKSLQRVLADKSSQAFLFSGPAGTGKTTLARIVAHKVGCETKDILEIDGATYTGVDDMRKVQDMLQYRPFGKATARGVIVDECHRLSKQAWDSLLKVVEEPPSYLYFFFCTTDPAKLPTTLKTRCSSFKLNPVSAEDIEDLLDRVMEAEKFNVPDNIIGMILKEAKGSPRQALVFLAMLRDVKDRREAAEIMQSASESNAVIELAQFLMGPKGSWGKAMAIVKKLEGENPESVRIVLTNYVTAAIKSDKGGKIDGKIGLWLNILDAFSTPYTSYDNQGPLILSIGKFMIES